MSTATEPLPGTSDIWEPEVLGWVELESITRDILGRYGYQELRTPVFERTEVFVRNLGNETDVVQKEMYTFEDRGGRSLTLRPEGTAGVMRAMANLGLGHGEERRVFYMGPMFRGERPSAGRRRQFHQVGVEAVGCHSPWMDAEVISMLVHYLDALGLNGARVHLNTRGLPEDRPAVAEALREYFRPHLSQMCEDCRRRFETNVWRMLDCKQETCHRLALGAPHIAELMGEESRAYFRDVCDGLEKLGVSYEVNPRLVRGLDYYIHTVFEVTHTGLGAQDALAGGGRYRIAFPGSKTPVEGIGFAAGMERLLIARQSLGHQTPERRPADVIVLCLGEQAVVPGLRLTQSLRAQFGELRIKTDYSCRSMKAQMRGANKIGAKLALILGENELAQGVAVCRDLTCGEQETIPLADIPARLAKTEF